SLAEVAERPQARRRLGVGGDARAPRAEVRRERAAGLAPARQLRAESSQGGRAGRREVVLLAGIGAQVEELLPAAVDDVGAVPLPDALEGAADGLVAVLAHRRRGGEGGAVVQQGCQAPALEPGRRR